MITELTFNVIKVFSLAAITSVLAILWCPILTNFLYKHKMWKTSGGKKAISGEDAIIFNSLHKEKEVGTPRMGGLLIWITVTVVIFASVFFGKFNFLSRSQTWLPLFTLIVASLVGLADDFLTVKGWGKYIGGGLSFKKRFFLVIIIGLIGSIWFYQKLGWDLIYMPFVGDVSIGLWYIPLFIVVTVATWSGGIIDGLDGLAGGTFASIFGAFTIISFSLGKIDLAAFCAVISGALFAFLWFNIPASKVLHGRNWHSGTYNCIGGGCLFN